MTFESAHHVGVLFLRPGVCQILGKQLMLTPQKVAGTLQVSLINVCQGMPHSMKGTSCSMLCKCPYVGPVQIFPDACQLPIYP